MYSFRQPRLKAILTTPEICPLAQRGIDEYFTITGAVNKISFEEIAVDASYQDEKKPAQKKPSTKIAYSSPRRDAYPKELSEALKGYNLLLEKRVPFDFIHAYLFFTGAFIKISLRAVSHLEDYVKQNISQLTADECKRLLAQMILAVFDFHTHQLVHRDIKPRNFLVEVRNGKFFCTLADLDTIVAVDEKGRTNPVINYVGTKEFEAPEADQHGVDYRAVDCWALGKTFEVLERLFKRISDEDFSHNLSDIVKSLSSYNSHFPENRATIQMVMQHKMFGKTGEERQIYFAHIRQEARQKLLIDGYEFTPPKKNNPFYLLDKSIKPIFHCAAKLVEQIEDQNCLLESKGLDNLLSRYEFSELIQRSGNELIAAIDSQYYKLARCYRRFLSKLKKSTQEEIAACLSAKPAYSILLEQAAHSALVGFKLHIPATFTPDQVMFYIIDLPHYIEIFLAEIDVIFKQKQNAEKFVEILFQLNSTDELRVLFKNILREKCCSLPDEVQKNFSAIITSALKEKFNCSISSQLLAQLAKTHEAYRNAFFAELSVPIKSEKAIEIVGSYCFFQPAVVRSLSDVLLSHDTKKHSLEMSRPG